LPRISAFRQSIDIAKSQLRGPARQAFMAETARAALAEAEATNRSILGHSVPFERIVDGRAGAVEESVRPGGSIAYVFDVAGEALSEAVDAAVTVYLDIAPRGTPPDPHPGLYAGSLLLLVNGQQRDASREVNATAGGAIEFTGTDIVSLTNLLPYARRIEQGWSAQAPNGVMEVVYAALRGRYGNLLNISFRYEIYPGVGAKGPSARRGSTRTHRHDDSFPTITMSVR
jgi:hypothetical protein